MHRLSIKRCKRLSRTLNLIIFVFFCLKNQARETPAKAWGWHILVPHPGQCTFSLGQSTKVCMPIWLCFFFTAGYSSRATAEERRAHTSVNRAKGRPIPHGLLVTHTTRPAGRSQWTLFVLVITRHGLVVGRPPAGSPPATRTRLFVLFNKLSRHRHTGYTTCTCSLATAFGIYRHSVRRRPDGSTRHRCLHI